MADRLVKPFQAIGRFALELNQMTEIPVGLGEIDLVRGVGWVSVRQLASQIEDLGRLGTSFVQPPEGGEQIRQTAAGAAQPLLVGGYAWEVLRQFALQLERIAVLGKSLVRL